MFQMFLSFVLGVKHVFSAVAIFFHALRNTVYHPEPDLLRSSLGLSYIFSRLKEHGITSRAKSVEVVFGTQPSTRDSELV